MANATAASLPFLCHTQCHQWQVLWKPGHYCIRILAVLVGFHSRGGSIQDLGFHFVLEGTSHTTGSQASLSCRVEILSQTNIIKRELTGSWPREFGGVEPVSGASGGRFLHSIMGHSLCSRTYTPLYWLHSFPPAVNNDIGLSSPERAMLSGVRPSLLW